MTVPLVQLFLLTQRGLQKKAFSFPKVTSKHCTESPRHNFWWQEITDTQQAPTVEQAAQDAQHLPCPCATVGVTPPPSRRNRCAPAAQPGRSQDSAGLVTAHPYGFLSYAERNAGLRTQWRRLYLWNRSLTPPSLYLRCFVQMVRAVLELKS